MKYLVTICIALLVVVLIWQTRILARLDDLAKRPVVPAGQPVPSAAAIASEIRKEMAREARLSGPAVFRIESKTATQAYQGAGESLDPTSGRLQRAGLVLVREGGPAADVAVTSPTNITSGLRRIGRTADFEQYEVSFKPTSGDFLPNEWTFAITYMSSHQKPEERLFAVTYHPGKKHPDYLDARQKDE